MTLAQIGAAAPAFAHGGGESAANLPATDSVARAVAIAAAALLAGVALIRPLAGRPTEPARRLVATITVAGILAALAGAAGHLVASRYLTLVPLLALTSAAALFAGTRPESAARSRRASAAVPVVVAPIAGLATVVWVCWAAIRDGFGEGFLMVSHVGVASLWAGAVLTSATAAPGTRGALVRRLGTVALGAGVLAAVTGVLSARNYDVTLHGITVSSFGTVVVVKVALLAGAGVLGLGVRFLLRGRRSGASRSGGILARAELTVLMGAVVAGAVLTSLPPPGPPPVAGAPLVRALSLDEATTGLVIAPQRPGMNLVHLMTDRLTDLVVAGHRYRAQPMPGSQGLWAEVELPAGRSLLEVHQGRQIAAQVINTGSGPIQIGLSGPDAAECAAAALGAVLGGSRAPLAACPSEALAPTDADALRALVANLWTRGVHRLQLISDATGRGAAADRLVRAAARPAGITIVGTKPDAVLDLAGWDVSQAALNHLRGQVPPLYGTYLAPWLLQAPAVTAAGGAPLTPLPFDPQGPQAQAYIHALRRVGPTESASTAGFLAYLAARGQTLPATPVLLYAATNGFDIMPMGTGAAAAAHDHGGVDESWLGGGSLTPVSKSLGPSAGSPG